MAYYMENIYFNVAFDPLVNAIYFKNYLELSSKYPLLIIPNSIINYLSVYSYSKNFSY